MFTDRIYANRLLAITGFTVCPVPARGYRSRLHLIECTTASPRLPRPPCHTSLDSKQKRPPYGSFPSKDLTRYLRARLPDAAAQHIGVSPAALTPQQCQD